MATRRSISVADTAKLVRKALKHNFPGFKFSVRSKSYSGGASIDVDWTDGPTTPDVDKIIKRFEGASFDGMIDLKSYKNSVLSHEDGTAEEVHFGADYIFSHRSFSDEAKAKIIAGIDEKYGGEFDDNRNYSGMGAVLWGSSVFYRESREVSFPAPPKKAKKKAETTT